MRKVCAAIVCGLAVGICGDVEGSAGELLGVLAAHDGVQGDSFGWSIAAQGHLLVVSAPRDDDLGSASGSVYLFDVSDAENPVETCKIVASDGGEGDRFGNGVVVCGTTLFVGAPSHNGYGVDAGAVYLFDVSDVYAPIELGKLGGNLEAKSGLFGAAITVHDELLLVGSPGSARANENAVVGKVFLYNVADPSKPVLQSVLETDDVDEWNGFGGPVATNGEIVLVGARWDTSEDQNLGTVYAFDIGNPQEPRELEKIVAREGSTLFGNSISISDNRAVIGSIWDAGYSTDSGAAFVFDLSDHDNIREVSKLRVTKEGVRDAFGYRCLIRGDLVYVSAINNISGAGGVYAFEVEGSGVVQQIYRVFPEEPESSIDLGMSLALVEETLFVGSRGGSTDPELTGTVYAFDMTACQCDANRDGVVDVDDLSYVLYRLGGSGRGDANGDGVIDVNDLSFVLGLLGSDC